MLWFFSMKSFVSCSFLLWSITSFYLRLFIHILCTEYARAASNPSLDMRKSFLLLSCFFWFILKYLHPVVDFDISFSVEEGNFQYEICNMFNRPFHFFAVFVCSLLFFMIVSSSCMKLVGVSMSENYLKAFCYFSWWGLLLFYNLSEL